jgi:hypothetical protein
MLFDSSRFPGKWNEAPAERDTVATLPDQQSIIGNFTVAIKQKRSASHFLLA